MQIHDSSPPIFDQAVVTQFVFSFFVTFKTYNQLCTAAFRIELSSYNNIAESQPSRT